MKCCLCRYSFDDGDEFLEFNNKLYCPDCFDDEYSALDVLEMFGITPRRVDTKSELAEADMIDIRLRHIFGEA